MHFSPIWFIPKIAQNECQGHQWNLPPINCKSLATMNPVQYLMDHGLQLNTNQHQASHSFTATKNSLEVIQNWRRNQMRENFKRQQNYRYLEQPFILVPSLRFKDTSSRGHQTTFGTKLTENEHNSTVQSTPDAFFKHDNSVATADKYLTTPYKPSPSDLSVQNTPDAFFNHDNSVATADKYLTTPYKPSPSNLSVQNIPDAFFKHDNSVATADKYLTTPYKPSNLSVQNTPDAFFKHDNSVATADKYLTTPYKPSNLSVQNTPDAFFKHDNSGATADKYLTTPYKPSNLSVQNTPDAFFKHDNSGATADKYLTTPYKASNLSQPDSVTANVSSANERVGLSAVGNLRRNVATLHLCETKGDDNSLSTKNKTCLAKLSNSRDQDDNKFGELDSASPGLPLNFRNAIEETKFRTKHETQEDKNRRSTFLQQLQIILREGDLKKKTANREMIDRIQRLRQSLGLDHARSNVTTEQHQFINTEAQLKSPHGINNSKSLPFMNGVPNQLACSVKEAINLGKLDTSRSTVSKESKNISSYNTADSNTASDGRRRKQTQMLLQQQQHLAQLVAKQRLLEAERKHLEKMKLSKIKHAKKAVLSSCYQDNQRKRTTGDLKTPRPTDKYSQKSGIDDIESLQRLGRRSVGKAIREKDSHMPIMTSRSLNLDKYNNTLQSRKSLENCAPHTYRVSRSDQLTSRRRCSTLEEWKRFNGVPESSKVFIVIGGYSDITKALVRRNWVQNPDPHSHLFDLIWTLRSKDIHVAALQDQQITNHFCRNTEITTKVGLLYNLSNLRLREDVDIDTFFPRCFDIWDESNLNEFIHTYKCLKAASILKLYISQKEKKDRERQQLVKRSGKQPGKDAIKNPSNDFCKSVIRTALSICQRQLRDLGDLIDHPTDSVDYASVKDHEWDILANVDLSTPNKILPSHRPVPTTTKFHRTKLKASVKRRRERERRASIRKKESGNKTVVIKKTISTSTLNHKGLGKHEPWHKGAPIPDNCSPHDLANDEDSETEAVLQVLEQMNARYPQYEMNGNRNLWIIKPAGMSRGRGIQVMESLDDILEKIRNRQTQWVCQKYIENPQIILGRKFDIRQWILVTGWNPLTIWFYNDSYLRFCADEYSNQDCDNLFAHLTNNSMAKNSENFEHSPIEGCMWTSDQYAAYLEEHNQQKNLWKTVIQPAIKKIVYLSLSSAQDVVEHRKNSCELYGYDLMVDENFNTWLLEINSSPSMDYSTKVTTSLVKQVLEDCIKVLIDYYDAPPNKRHNIDTGKFLLLHKNKQVITKPPGALALSFTVQGKLLSLDKVRGF